MSLILIPGPVELSENVKLSFNDPALVPADPLFIAIFQRVLKNTRKLFNSTDPSSQPLVISGSGTLGWDLFAANSIDNGDNVLVIDTGFFSEHLGECLESYGAQVTYLKAEVGDIVPLKDIEAELGKKQYKAVTVTQVDTSTAVLNDVEGICNIIKKVSPESLIFVDGVCSIACETFEFDKWGVDFCASASQKAIGAPVGLSVSIASGRFVKLAESHKNIGYFTSLKKWIPIMKSYEGGASSYFATIPVETVNALDAALTDIFNYPNGLQGRIEATKKTSDEFKSNLQKLGLKLVSINENCQSHGVTAVFVDNPQKVIKYLRDNGVVITGGLLKDIGPKYIRIGHMGVSACDPKLNHVQRCLELITEAIKE
ncbi:hypothetical protein Kpol_1035p37 [Vanderwaltozyma polyspora DSM 70294]|uniref:alanine--glyoxylate transaminase n=1 Tax=Vanderwaltozyma polyspora (strain ATCC 22028 / DSM 70294 / BCRC 21397 / CBS 2163 / NBRC 10782 / NRRL Y-8283 / UCD 57-17) TaxID=436907 RepID=A7TKK2_VANPO|nr:uncharacterized protein Kpol_1035p37 [Vanderwaltozyma polyspora DSM 70294]EDO17224.1 hypothetical protein Kpol_1035p37 [Vanderwaltozyma polyspora DSM 70294]